MPILFKRAIIIPLLGLLITCLSQASASASATNEYLTWTDKGNGIGFIDLGFTLDNLDPFVQDKYTLTVNPTSPYPDNFSPVVNLEIQSSFNMTSNLSTEFQMTPKEYNLKSYASIKVTLSPPKEKSYLLAANYQFKVITSINSAGVGFGHKAQVFYLNIPDAGSIPSQNDSNWTLDHFLKHADNMANTFIPRLHALLEKRFGFAGTYTYIKPMPSPNAAELSAHTQAAYDAYAARLEKWLNYEIANASLSNYRADTDPVDQENAAPSDSLCGNLYSANKVLISNWDILFTVLINKFNGLFELSDQNAFKNLSSEVRTFDQKFPELIKANSKCMELYGQKSQLDFLITKIDGLQNFVTQAELDLAALAESDYPVIDGEEVIETALTYSKRKDGRYIIMLESDLTDEELIVKASKKGHKTIKYTVTTNQDGIKRFTTTRNIQNYKLKVYFQGELVDRIYVKD